MQQRQARERSEKNPYNLVQPAVNVPHHHCHPALDHTSSSHPARDHYGTTSAQLDREISGTYQPRVDNCRYGACISSVPVAPIITSSSAAPRLIPQVTLSPKQHRNRKTDTTRRDSGVSCSGCWAAVALSKSYCCVALSPTTLYTRTLSSLPFTLICCNSFA